LDSDSGYFGEAPSSNTSAALSIWRMAVEIYLRELPEREFRHLLAVARPEATVS
jgi:hypothetical protein